MPPSPRGNVLEPFGRVARAGFEVAGHVGHHAKEAFKHNVADAVELAKQGVQTAGHVASVVGNASKRALSTKAAQVHEAASSAMEPGSNTRRAIAGAASKTAEVAGTVAGATKHVLDVAGPPVIHGAYAAAATTGHVAKVAAHGLGHAASAAAHVTANHILPAAGAAAKRGAVMAAHALSSTTLSAVDIINAIKEMRAEGELEAQQHYSAYNALENGSHAQIGYGKFIPRKRNSTPPRGNTKRTSAGAAREPAKPARTAQEWLEYAGNKQRLVEELLQRPNWKQVVQNVHNTPELRKKLHTLSQQDLAEILAQM